MNRLAMVQVILFATVCGHLCADPKGVPKVAPFVVCLDFELQGLLPASSPTFITDLVKGLGELDYLTFQGPKGCQSLMEKGENPFLRWATIKFSHKEGPLGEFEFYFHLAKINPPVSGLERPCRLLWPDPLPGQVRVDQEVFRKSQKDALERCVKAFADTAVKSAIYSVVLSTEVNIYHPCTQTVSECIATDLTFGQFPGLTLIHKADLIRQTGLTMTGGFARNCVHYAGDTRKRLLTFLPQTPPRVPIQQGEHGHFKVNDFDDSKPLEKDCPLWP